MDKLFAFQSHQVPKNYPFPINHRHPGSRIPFHISFPRPVAPKLTHDPSTSAAQRSWRRWAGRCSPLMKIGDNPLIQDLAPSSSQPIKPARLPGSRYGYGKGSAPQRSWAPTPPGVRPHRKHIGNLSCRFQRRWQVVGQKVSSWDAVKAVHEFVSLNLEPGFVGRTWFRKTLSARPPVDPEIRRLTPSQS